MNLEPKTRYYVGEQVGEREPQVRDWDPFPNQSSVEGEVELFNREEAELARLEFRSVQTRYFAVKAVTTYQEIET